MHMPKVGDKVPNFQAVDTEGVVISTEDLFGSIAVIYFYPKDDTPNCTKEACDFRDKMAEIDMRGVVVLGISPDSMKSHEMFADKYKLNFSLLTDESKEICKKFDVLKVTEVEGKKVECIERTTFIVDEKGTIRWMEKPVNVDNHIERVVKAIDELL